MLDFLFGKSFWSTVIRAALFVPTLSLITFPVALIFASPDEIAIFKSYGVTQWAANLILTLTFGAWAGWGFAYWRFANRPVGRGWFSIFPLVTGLGFGPLMFWMLMESPPVPEQIGTGERMAVMIFGAIVGPIMALAMSLFWRYALNLTAVKRHVGPLR